MLLKSIFIFFNNLYLNLYMIELINEKIKLFQYFGILTFLFIIFSYLFFNV